MWKGRQNYSRKLIGMTLIATLLGMYFLNGGKNILMVVGGFLLLEHYFVWDRWDAYDFLLGHEWWGLYLISIAYLVSGMWLYSILTILGFLVGATYNKFDTFGSVKKTIMELFRD